MKTTFYRFLFLTLGALLAAIATDLFYVPKHLLNGGTTGFGMLIYYTTGIPIGIATMACNLPIFIYAYFKISREYVVAAGYTMVACALFTDYFSFLTPVLNDTLLTCLAGGIISGIGSACIFRMGSSSGGADIIATLINRKFAIPMATTIFMINILVVTLGSFVSGLEPAIFTMVAFFVSAKACNAFVIGFDFKKNIIIISEHPDEIAREIIQVVGRGVTFFYGEGAYTHQHRKVVFVVARLTQTAQIRQLVNDIDPNAFMIMHDVNDVYGKGFTLNKDLPAPQPQNTPGGNNE